MNRNFQKETYRYLFYTLFFVSFAFQNIHAQTTVTLGAVADTKLDLWASTINYGNAGDLQTYPWVIGTGNYTRRILIKFDVSSILAGAIIISAILHLYETGTRGYNRTLAAHKVTTPWSEMSVTNANFNNAFSSSPSALAQLSWPSGINGAWDLKNDVQAFINGGANYGWLVKDNNEDGSQSFWQFASKEYSNAGLRPVLKVSYTIAAQPTLNVSPSAASICAGNSVQLTASGANSYLWSPAVGLSSTTDSVVTASPIVTTTYTAIGTFASGQTSSKTVTVIVNNKPALTVSPIDYVLLQGSSVQLLATGANSYSWSPATGLTATNIANPTAAPTNTTTYTVTGTNLNGCGVSKSITVNVSGSSLSTCSGVNSNITAEIIPACSGQSTGRIKLSGLDTIFNGQLSLADCSKGEVITGNNITVNQGETKRIINSIANANININGGKLIICAPVTISNLSISNEGSLINNAGLAIYSPITIPEGSSLVNNNGSMALYSSVTVDGLLFNLYGSIAHYSTLTVNDNGEVINNSTMTNASTGDSYPINYDETEAKKSSYVLWTGTSQEGTDVYGLPAGTYTVTVYLGSCATTKVFTIPSVNSPQVDGVVTSNTSLSNCDGKIHASVNGGDAPYYFAAFNANDEKVSNNQVVEDLCEGTYSMRVMDSKGCYSAYKSFNVNYVEETIDTTGDSVNDTTQIDTIYIGIPEDDEVVIDTLASILKKTGSNVTWDLTNIEIARFAPEVIEDTSMHANISPSIIFKNYSLSQGDSLTINSPDLTFTVDDIPFTKMNNNSIMFDATGDLIIAGNQYLNLKRVKVIEDCNYFCSGECDGTDTIKVKIESYYWFASDTSTVPLFIYRESSKAFLDEMLMEFYQDITLTNEVPGFDLDAFRRAVDLRVNPNPALGSNILITYNLPQTANIILSINNNSTGSNTVIQSLNQTNNTYSLNYNIDSFLTGSYTLNLNIDGVIISQPLIINN